MVAAVAAHLEMAQMVEQETLDTMAVRKVAIVQAVAVEVWPLLELLQVVAVMVALA
jgi:hypothetical protein